MSSTKPLSSGAFPCSQGDSVNALHLLRLAPTAGRLLFGASYFSLVALVTGQAKFLSRLGYLASPRLTMLRS